MHVTLVTSDPQLDELLCACGARVHRVSLNELAAHSASTQPDVLVIDQRSRSSVPEAVTAFKHQHPATGVLMVLRTLDGSVMLEAMRAGVTECIADPLTVEELQAALNRVMGHRASSRRGQVFAILGAKGGVGATTVAVNIAATLNTLRPATTILIDLHATCGDAAVYLGAEPRFSVVDALENMHRLDPTFLRSVVAHTTSGVLLLASSDRPATVAVEAAHVRRLIELAATEFAYVVLDVPRSDAVMLDALEHAHPIVVVANQELAAVRSASRVAAAMERRYGKERVSVVLTRYSDASDIVQEDVERVVGRPVRHVFPSNYSSALASQNTGRPLVLDQRGPLANALTRFTRSLANFPVERHEHQKSGLRALIGGRRR